MDSGSANTDRELWRTDGSFYADVIHVTVNGGIGINVGGLVIVKPLAEWHRLALADMPEKSKMPTKDMEGASE